MLFEDRTQNDFCTNVVYSILVCVYALFLIVIFVDVTPGVNTELDPTVFVWIVYYLWFFFKILLIYFFALTFVLWRRFGCFLLANFVVVVLTLILSLIFAGTLTVYYLGCNDSKCPDNPCNDRLWCCVYTDPDGDCPTGSNPCMPPYPSQASELSPHPWFVRLYIYVWVALGLEVLCLLLALMTMYTHRDRRRSKHPCEPCCLRIKKLRSKATYVTGRYSKEDEEIKMTDTKNKKEAEDDMFASSSKYGQHKTNNLFGENTLYRRTGQIS